MPEVSLTLEAFKDQLQVLFSLDKHIGTVVHTVTIEDQVAVLISFKRLKDILKVAIRVACKVDGLVDALRAARGHGN